MPQPQIIVTPHLAPIEVEFPAPVPEQVTLVGIGGRGPTGVFSPTDLARIAALETGKSDVGHGHSAATGSVAGFMAAADKTKLDGVAAGATANATDAQLRDRATHTGAQAIATVTGLQTALDGKADLVSGKVPSTQLPSFVDDVLEYANLAAFPGAGETGKIYVALDTGKTYRWGGSAYAEISASPGSTDAVPEGSSNLYHTAARVNALIASAVGSVVQAYSATLTALAALTTTAFGRSLLTQADAAALRVTVALPTSTTTGRLARYTDTAGAQGQSTGILESATGNIGIGTTSSPVPKLDIVTGNGTGLVNEAAAVRIRHSATDGNTMTMQLGVNNTSMGGANNGYAYMQAVYWGASNNCPIILNPQAGGVGIGTGTNSIGGHILLVQEAMGLRAPTLAGNGTLMGRVNFVHGGSYTNIPVYIAGVYDKSLWSHGSGLVFATLASADTSNGAAIERMRISSDGNVGIGTQSPTALLDVASDTVRVRTARTPASAAAAGNAGDICWDANYVYLCVATNSWKRAALATW